MGWLESAKNWASEQARTVEVATQGVTRGLASSVGGIGDLAVGVGYNWTVRHLTGGEKVQTNFADRAANSVTWTEAKNDRERAIMAGGQVAGEIAGFVAVTVATGGLGGAAVGGGLAVARGANVVRAVAGATRGVEAVSVATQATATAARAAGATAKFVNPLASKTALGIESAVGAWRGHDIYTTDKAAAAMADSVRTDMAQSVIGTALAEQTALGNSAQRVQTELENIMDELNNPALSNERHTALMTQLDNVEAHNSIIQKLQSDDVTPEQRETLWNDLKAADPIVDQDLKAAEKAPAAAGSLGANFENAANNIAQNNAAPAAEPDTQKPVYKAPVINAPVV
jgi:hypothetical protein